MMVVLHHSHPYFAGIQRYKISVLLDTILKDGDKGVTLFFLMSAFTLCLSLVKNQGVELHPIRNYFLRRLFRILPLYYFALAAVLLSQINTPDLGAIAANLLCVHGLNPYWINGAIPGGWSVGVEVLFYLFFPFLFRQISSAASALTITLVFIIIAKLIIGFMFKHPLIGDQLTWGIFTYENIISQLPVFMIGICLYFISSEEIHRRSDLSKPTCLIAVLIIIHLLGGNLFKEHYLFAIAFAFLAYGLSKYPASLLVNSFTAFVGKLSYSIYLVHILIANLLVKYNLTHYSSNAGVEVFIRFIIIFCVSIIISCFTYNFIEKPFQRLGKNIILKMESTALLKRKPPLPPSLSDIL